MVNRIKKEVKDIKTTVELDLGILSIETIVNIFEDMQAEIVYRKEENDKLRVAGKPYEYPSSDKSVAVKSLNMEDDHF